MDLRQFDSRPKALKIDKIIKENKNINTYVFKYPLGALPGQFVMAWIPGVDEKPFSVSYDNGQEFWLTVCDVGPATDQLFKMKVGQKIGIRGPLGTHYEFKKGDHLALVAGGYGAAPMYFVAREAAKRGCKVEFIVGARTKSLLLFTKQIKALGKNVHLHVSTDDGSEGFKGYTTQVLENLMNKTKITKVFSCGPEIMMKFVGQIAEKHKAQCYLSVEKYMKCGIGVCGQCAVDDTGVLACKSGPVMDFQYLKKLPEFGKYHRDAQGKKHHFK